MKIFKQKILTKKNISNDNNFIIRAKNILPSQKQQTSRGFLLSLKENSELVLCYFNDSRELIRVQN